jgi:hypothetical protein
VLPFHNLTTFAASAEHRAIASHEAGRCVVARVVAGSAEDAERDDWCSARVADLAALMRC